MVQLQDATNGTIQSVKLGDNVTIKCYMPQTSVTTMVWYKQSIGESPTPVALSYNYLSDTKFVDEFQNGRFNASPKRGSFHLNITAVTQEDTGTYYCGIVFLNRLHFVSWTFLMPTETKVNNIKQPMLELVHPRDSVTLQCSVLTESCSGDHSVYWFRRGSGESHPGIIYTHGNSNGQCKKMTKTLSPTQSCVYKLPKRNLSLSDAGAHYCAVAMCGDKCNVVNAKTVKMRVFLHMSTYRYVIFISSHQIMDYCHSYSIYLCSLLKGPFVVQLEHFDYLKYFPFIFQFVLFF
uniref:Ig-like domain-containing protein n=1 Tax=Pygocentrus nattereri TaxID=42514 RepID=A0A3B4C8E6_PYGNA